MRSDNNGGVNSNRFFFECSSSVGQGDEANRDVQVTRVSRPRGAAAFQISDEERRRYEALRAEGAAEIARRLV